MRKQGSLTLTKSTNGHQFSFLSPLQISLCQALANLTLPSSFFPPQIPIHRKWWVWEARGIKLVWKVSSKSVFENILLGKAMSAAVAGKAERSAGSPSPHTQDCQGTGTHRDGAWHQAEGIYEEQGFYLVSALSWLLLGHSWLLGVQ